MIVVCFSGTVESNPHTHEVALTFKFHNFRHGVPILYPPFATVSITSLRKIAFTYHFSFFMRYLIGPYQTCLLFKESYLLIYWCKIID